MNKITEVLAFLDNHNIPYRIMRHAPVFTMEEMEKEGICSAGTVCKNLFLRDQKGNRHFLICADKDTRIDLKKLGEKLGTRLSFASEQRLEKYLNLQKGAVTPLGLIYDNAHEVEVIIDQALQEEEEIGVHPCENTATVFVSVRDLESLIRKLGNPVRYLEMEG